MLNVVVIYRKTSVVFREIRALGLVTRNRTKMFQRTYKYEVKSKLYVCHIMQSRASGLLYGEEMRLERRSQHFAFIAAVRMQSTDSRSKAPGGEDNRRVAQMLTLKILLQNPWVLQLFKAHWYQNVPPALIIYNSVFRICGFDGSHSKHPSFP